MSSSPVKLPRLLRQFTATAAVALAGLSAGCAHTRRVGGERTLRIALTEYRLNPERASVSAGTLTILVHNYGRLTHNLVVSQSSQSLGSTKPLAPGESAELSLSLAAGTYMMTSTMQADEALGEYGTLSVG